MIGIVEMFAELDGYTRMHDMMWRPPPRLEHGYRAYTTFGCRCETCRAANADYMRGYKARRAQEPAYVAMRRRWNRESEQRRRARRKAAA